MNKKFPKIFVMILAVYSSLMIPFFVLSFYTFMAGPDGPYSPLWPNAYYSPYLWLLLPVAAILLFKPLHNILHKGGILAIILLTLDILMGIFIYLILNSNSIIVVQLDKAELLFKWTWVNG